MKCQYIQVILKPAFAHAAGQARLANEEDKEVSTPEEARAYQGSVFEQDGVSCKDLHVVYQGGMACVNFKDEEGVHVNYDYPVDTLARIKHY